MEGEGKGIGEVSEYRVDLNRTSLVLGWKTNGGGGRVCVIGCTWVALSVEAELAFILIRVGTFARRRLGDKLDVMEELEWVHLVYSKSMIGI